MLLSETEGNVLDNANLSSSLLELRKELGKSDDRVSGMKDMKKDMKTASLQYLSAAQHATILYETIQHLRCINPMYQYSFDWFTKVFRSSIENSNKSNNIEKRLRYLKDHLTYSLFCQVSYSLQDEDGLIFAFLLCCKLMIKENKVPAQGLAMLIKLWKVVTTEDIASSNDNDKSKEVLPPGLDWLGQSAWDFLHEYSSHFPEMKGLCNDFVDSNARWKLLYEAKEPDNLPLHEPWYSRLGRFHKLVIVATLRMDKLHELVYSFVSDHIGYKFVEPVQFDLGRIFSECDPSQPLVYTVQGPNEAVEDICRFAKEREKSLIQLSMGVEDEAWVKETVLSTLETGDKWVVLENFDNTRNIEEILRHHIRIDQDFHAGYRLWMITRPTYHFPVPELQQCLKLTSEPAGSIREALIEAFTRSSIKEAKCWSGDRQSIGGAERHMSRLLYCLAFFHASLNERCTYGAIGGWSTRPTFSDHDLTLGVHYLEMMSKEFDTINFQGLRELLGHCGYGNLFMDPHDRTLLETILDGCINEKSVSTNRYRFCVAVNDFFVPNKTLYKDYIEFIKALPSTSDHEVLDLDCSCQILNDKKRGTRFLLTLYPTLSGSSPYSKVGVVSSLEKLLTCVQEAIKAHDSFPFLKDGPLKWLWINEMTRHDSILAMAFQQLDRLNKCVRGAKVLDDHSKGLAETLAQGKVPKKWLGEVCKSTLSQSIGNFIRIITERTDFYKVQHI